MRKVNISALNRSDLDALVQNAKQVFKPSAGATLNSVRHNIAKLLGGKCWASVTSAVKQEEQEEGKSFNKKTVYVVKKLCTTYDNNFCDVEVAFSRDQAIQQFVHSCVESDFLDMYFDLGLDSYMDEAEVNSLLLEEITAICSPYANPDLYPDIYEACVSWAAETASILIDQHQDEIEDAEILEISPLPDLLAFNAYRNVYGDEEIITIEEHEVEIPV